MFFYIIYMRSYSKTSKSGQIPMYVCIHISEIFYSLLYKSTMTVLWFDHSLHFFLVLEAYAIVSRNYFLRGKEATFVVKRSKWSSGLPSYSWKVNNGTVMPSGPNFTHTFNETGRYCTVHKLCIYPFSI